MSLAENIKMVSVHTINLAMAHRRLKDGIKQHKKTIKNWMLSEQPNKRTKYWCDSIHFSLGRFTFKLTNIPSQNLFNLTCSQNCCSKNITIARKSSMVIIVSQFVLETFGLSSKQFSINKYDLFQVTHACIHRGILWIIPLGKYVTQGVRYVI